VRLDAALLDRIDEIVPPGTNFSYTDAGFSLRRSPTRPSAAAERAVGGYPSPIHDPVFSAPRFRRARVTQDAVR
jgi:hypothetical protein